MKLSNIALAVATLLIGINIAHAAPQDLAEETANYNEIGDFIKFANAFSTVTESSPPSEVKMFVGHTVNDDGNNPHCAYNSFLAHHIHQAYEQQHETSNPRCEGLTKEEILSINFKEVDFSGFLTSSALYEKKSGDQHD